MVSKATLSTISSLIKSMRTRKASKYDFIVHVDSKGYKAPDGETHYHCGVPNKPDGTPRVSFTVVIPGAIPAQVM